MVAIAPKQIVALLRTAGLTDTGRLHSLAAIALAESGGEVGLVRGSRRGVWLINDSRGFDRRRMVTDAAYAAAKAVEISRRGEVLSLWPSWTNGRYKQFLNAARQGDAQSASVSGMILAEDGTYVPRGYYDSDTPAVAPAPATSRMVRAEDGSYVPASFYAKPAGVRAEDGSYVPASFYNNVTPAYAAMRGTAAFTVGGPGQPITASFERQEPLRGLRVTGTQLTGDIASIVIGDPEYSASVSEIPNLSFVIADPQGDLLWKQRNLWQKGNRVQYLDLDMRIDEIKFAPGGHGTGQLEITCIDGLVYALQRLRGARVDKSVTPTGFIWSEIRLAGYDPNVFYLGEKTAVMAQIARDVPTQQASGGESDPPSAWTTIQRLAKETGRRAYISGRKLIFGSVAFSRDWAAPGDLRIGWHSSPEGERWLTMPSASGKSEGSTAGGTEVTGRVPLNRARYFRPGVSVIVHNTPSVAAGDRRMVCISIAHTLSRDVDGAEVVLSDPIDPKPEKTA